MKRVEPGRHPKTGVIHLSAFEPVDGAVPALEDEGPPVALLCGAEYVGLGDADTPVDADDLCQSCRRKALNSDAYEVAGVVIE